MREMFKAMVPERMLRAARAIRRKRNERQILEACRCAPQIRIVPANRVEHYYHFIFDLVLPIWQVIERAPSTVVFHVQHFGIFSERLTKLFPNRIHIEPLQGTMLPMPTKTLLGMNSQFVKLRHPELASLREHTRAVLGLDLNPCPNKILLIERMPPNAYFKTQAVKKGGGTWRRSIPNHSELVSAINAELGPGSEFHNLQLENLSFENQVQIFGEAKLVIAQHGAGLANCIWMQSGGNVIELSHDPTLKHFANLSKTMGHEHVVFRTPNNHPQVDVAQVVALVKCSLGSSRKTTEIGGLSIVE